MKPLEQNDFLIYGKSYHLWREGVYLGIATWTDDENIGDSFLSEFEYAPGMIGLEVYKADQWMFVN